MTKRGKQQPTNRTISKKARRFRRRVKWTFIAVLVIAGLYAYDRGGPLEEVSGRVAALRTYPHGNGTDRHTHVEADLEFDGARHAVRPADELKRGDRVIVEVRRGRLSGIRRYASHRKE